jgi:preprotein translocase subunit SecE
LVRLNRPQRLRPTGLNRAFYKEKKKMAKFAPIEFFKQVRAEAKRVTWPTRPETVSSTIAVFIMVVIASIFLFAADQLLSWIVRLVLGLGN